MEKRRKTYMDRMGVAPEMQEELLSFINLSGGKSLAYSKAIVANPYMFQASIFFFVVPLIGSIAHNLGYISELHANELTMLIGLPLFYLINLMSTATIVVILFYRFLKTWNEHAPRDRQ